MNLTMSPLFVAVRRVLLPFALGVWLAGCDAEGKVEAKKIDVAAQVAGLKGDADAKTAALAELAAGGPNAAPAVPEITVLLKDPEPSIRRLAAYTLSQVGPGAKSAKDALKESMQDSDPSVVMASVNALRMIDPSSVADVKVENVMAPAEAQ
jgi:HEAT repeat protein